MESDKNKEILHKSCQEKISNLKIQLEEKDKDNIDMFKKYKESLTKYYISNEIAGKLKLELKEIENKYNFIENQLNKLIDEKREWTHKDEHTTSFLHENGFQKPEELAKFIIKYKSHKCSCNCLPIKETLEYKEMIMKLDICKVNEIERLKIEKEYDKIRWEIEDGNNKISKLEKENIDLKNKLSLNKETVDSIDIINVEEIENNGKIVNDIDLKTDIKNNSNINVEQSSEYINSFKTKQKDIEEDYIKIQNKANHIDVENDEKFIKLKEENNNLKYENENKIDVVDEINNMKMQDLRKFCKDNNIYNYSKLRKEELIKYIINSIKEN